MIVVISQLIGRAASPLTAPVSLGLAKASGIPARGEQPGDGFSLCGCGSGGTGSVGRARSGLAV